MRVFDLAIIGAGPVGLEAAARAAEVGLETVVLEAGPVASHVADWGFVRLFSPFSFNTGMAGLARLQVTGVTLPTGDEIMTAREFRETYLLPLASELRSGLDIHEHTRVMHIARAAWLKGDALGSPERAGQPFRLLAESEGTEREWLARSVIDSSGSYGRHNWAGPGGTPARGERALRDRIEYRLPDVLGADRSRYGGQRTLLVGGGHSAATTAAALTALGSEVPGTRFKWATRRSGPAPLSQLEDDPLPERARLIERANRLAAQPPPGSEWVAEARLVSVGSTRDGFDAELEIGGSVRSERFDRVIANVGYEPDDSLYRQLQVHECYASRGPMKLASALLAASGDGPADCLAQGGFGPDALQNPEPGFFILGAKSFGKNSAFLMRTGYEQVQDAFSLLAPVGLAAG